jgi:hypothetical protein
MAISTDEIVNAMAESAHEAWMSWYADRGITSRKAAWGEEFLVPFDELSEDGKELDRIIMRAILGAFDNLGLKVVGG